MPVSEAGAPSAYVEIGWADQDLNADPAHPIWASSTNAARTVMVESDAYPSWNQ